MFSILIKEYFIGFICYIKKQIFYIPDKNIVLIKTYNLIFLKKNKLFTKINMLKIKIKSIYILYLLKILFI